MAILTLQAVWINLLATGQAISAPSTGRSQLYTMTGDVRDYAGGRQRFVGTEGERGQFTVTLRRLTLAQVTTLRGWKGQTVLFRDRRGQAMYGVFTGVTPNAEYKDLLYDAEISIQLVSQTEGI